MPRFFLPSSVSLPVAASERLTSSFDAHVLVSARIQASGHPVDSLLLRLFRASALTLGRRVIARPGALDPETPDGLRLLAHELAHVRQYRELGAATFIWRYLREYLGGRFMGKGHWQAYHDISFEREARAASREIAG